MMYYHVLLESSVCSILQQAGMATRDEKLNDDECVTPPAATDRRVPSSASDPKWKKPCPARVGKGEGTEDGESKKPASMPKGAKGKGKGSGKGKGRKGALPSSSDAHGTGNDSPVADVRSGREGALPSSSDANGTGNGSPVAVQNAEGSGREAALPTTTDADGTGNDSPAVAVQNAKGSGREGAVPSSSGTGNGSPDAEQNAKGSGRRGRERALPNDANGAGNGSDMQNAKGRGRQGGKGQGGKGANQDEAAIRRQQVSEENLQRIRDLATKHPELQPQVGFTAKQL